MSAAELQKIKTRLCLTGVYDATTITWGCLTAQTTLQASMQEVVTTVSDNQKLLITAVSADFVLTQTNAGDVCAGKTLSLAVPLVNNDRLVASNVGDLSPGTLIQKLTAGTNVTLDAITTPGQVIINSDNDHFVLAGAGDITPGLLIDKVLGSTNNGITLNPTYNAGTDQVDFTLTTSLAVLAANLMTFIAADATLLSQFCAMTNTCVADSCATTLYSVNNTSGSAQNIFWLTCGSGTYLSVSVPTATTINICALTDSIIPVVGVAITGIGACPAVSP